MHTTAGYAIAHAIDRVRAGQTVGIVNMPDGDEAGELSDQLAALQAGKSAGEFLGDVLTVGILAGRELADAEWSDLGARRFG